MSPALALAASLLLGAAPDPSGVYRGGDKVIAISPAAKAQQFTVQQYGATGDGELGRVSDAQPRNLLLGEYQILEFSPDFKRFTVTVSSEVFGALKAREIFLRLTTGELEKLARGRELEAARDEARALLTSLYAAAHASFAKKGEYPKELSGIALDGCPDGTHAPGTTSELTGCRFVARIEVRGVGEQGVFTATALGVAAPAKGQRLTISSAARGSTPAGVVRVEK